jgi:hypothetical protein
VDEPAASKTFRQTTTEAVGSGVTGEGRWGAETGGEEPGWIVYTNVEGLERPSTLQRRLDQRKE